jgi:hypothetical protein
MKVPIQLAGMKKSPMRRNQAQVIFDTELKKSVEKIEDRYYDVRYRGNDFRYDGLSFIRLFHVPVSLVRRGQTIVCIFSHKRYLS